MIEAKYIGSWKQDAVKEICEHYGYDAQSQIAIEECLELIKAICKRQRKYAGSNDPEYRDSPERSAIIEELADVQIMVWQLQYFLGALGDIEKEIHRKLERQMKRIEKECKVKFYGGRDNEE